MRILSLFLILILCLLSPPDARAIQETDYAQTIVKQVLPYIKQNLVRESFVSFDKTRIVYAILKVPNSRATVVLCPGRTESIIGLSEVIYDLAHLGFSVAIVDHRGQGESQRLVPNSNVGHVGSFYDYVDDFKIFVDQHVKTELPGPYLLMASSMGGAIASFYLIEEPATFVAAALGAPMIRISVAPFPVSILSDIAWAIEAFEPSTDFAPTCHPYDFDQKFEGNIFTHSSNRFYLDRALTRKYPQIATGGPSLGWFQQAVRAGNELSAQASRMRTPFLLFQAAEDQVVDNQASTAFCATAPKCELKFVPGADHWIFMEQDAIRNRLFLDVDWFFTSQLAAGSRSSR